MMRESKLARAIVPALLTLAVLLVFAQVRTFEFIYLDDDVFLVNNPFVAQGLTSESVRWACTSTATGAVWHPLVWLSHMADVELFGMNPGAHHLVNLALHLVSALLLCFIYTRWTGSIWCAGWVAGLFALHPLRVESVAWITERKDVLSGLFFMLTLLAYTRYAERSSVARYGAVVVCLVAGLMAKAMLITLPVVLLLLDVWPLRRVEDGTALRQRLIEKIPLFAIAATAAAAFRFAQLTPLSASTGNLKAVATAALAYLHYLKTTFLPTELAVYYPHDPDPSGWAVALALTLLTCLTLAFALGMKRFPFLFVGWTWFVLTLLPVSGLVQIGRLEAAADRYTYLPSVGLAIVLVEVGRRIRPRSVAIVLGVGAMLACMFVARHQTRYWSDSETLFERTLAVTTDNDYIHFNLGTFLSHQGRVDEGLEHFREALRINPAYPEANKNIAVVMLKRGQLELAERHFRKEIAISPHSAEAHTYLGVTLAQSNRLAEAIPLFEAAVRHAPELSDAQYNLGLARMATGRPLDAMKSFVAALDSDPDCADCAFQLANALVQLEERDRALFVLRELLRRRPDYSLAAQRLRGLEARP